jgi:hypothetical protein
MRLVVRAGWRSALALLIAVSSALLFSIALHMPSALERGAGEGESCTTGHPNAPVVSRPQESLDRSARRDDDTDPFEPCLHGDPLVAAQVFIAWSLPAPSTSPRTHVAGGWYARGPPAVMC